MSFLALSVLLALGGAEVYRWVDADGVVHFSDRPRAGAERVVVDVAPAIRVAPPPAATAARPAAEPGYLPYRQVTIDSPAEDEVLWNIEGQLDVTFTVDPPLQAGHRLQLYLDGEPVATLDPDSSNQTRLSAVYRGAHTLEAEVVDREGASLLRSEPLRFSVRQTSIQNPVNPVLNPPQALPQPLPQPSRP
jgi:hypothetical protein